MSQEGEPLSWPVARSVNKVFHVSPLMGMDASYGFGLSEPTDRLAVVIHQYQNGKLTMIAAQQGEGHELTDRHLLSALVRVPLLPFKIMAAIHWQALKIWLRGASFFPKPAPPIDKVTQ